MKNISRFLLPLIVFLVLTSVVYSQVPPITPMNLPEVFDNSMPLAKSAEEGYNMFTDNTFTTLKSPYADKIKLIKDYEVKVNDYIVATSEYAKGLLAGNDPILNDTSRNYMNRNIKNVNLEMTDIFMLEFAEIGAAQIEFSDHLNTIPDNKEKIRQLNTYISGKYADLSNKYYAMYHEKLVTIYGLYQESNFANEPPNPFTRINIASSLYATLEAYVNHKNEVAKATAERLAKDYVAYKN